MTNLSAAFSGVAVILGAAPGRNPGLFRLPSHLTQYQVNSIAKNVESALRRPGTVQENRRWAASMTAFAAQVARGIADYDITDDAYNMAAERLFRAVSRLETLAMRR